MEMEMWFAAYAQDCYGAAADSEAAQLFAAVCGAAVRRGSSIDPIGSYAAEVGQKEYVIWWQLRDMMQGMRVRDEIVDAVQLWQDLQDLPEDEGEWEDAY